MGTGKASSATGAKPKTPRRPGTKKPKAKGAVARLTAEELHLAIRTLAVAAACYQNPKPMLDARDGGGSDRVVEDALRDAVAAMARARKRQMELSHREAELILRDGLREAVAAYRGKPIPANQHRSPIGPVVVPDERHDSSPEGQFRLAVDVAVGAYEFLAGSHKISPGLIEKGIRQVVEGRDEHEGAAAADLYSADEMFESVIGVTNSAMAKRKRERRYRPGELPWVYVMSFGRFFGAARTPTAGALAAGFGGPAFLASALGDLPPLEAMRCAAFAFDKHWGHYFGLRRSQGVVAKGADWAELGEHAGRLHSAMDAVAALLRDPKGISPDMAENPWLIPGFAYPPAWISYPIVVSYWAKPGDDEPPIFWDRMRPKPT